MPQHHAYNNRSAFLKEHIMPACCKSLQSKGTHQRQPLPQQQMLQHCRARQRLLQPRQLRRNRPCSPQRRRQKQRQHCLPKTQPLMEGHFLT